jgi:hypothetical protein
MVAPIIQSIRAEGNIGLTSIARELTRRLPPTLAALEPAL